MLCTIAGSSPHTVEPYFSPKTSQVIASGAVITGIALLALALVAHFVTFPHGFSLFNQPVTYIITGSVGQALIGGGALYLTIRCCLNISRRHQKPDQQERPQSTTAVESQVNSPPTIIKHQPKDRPTQQTQAVPNLITPKEPILSIEEDAACIAAAKEFVANLRKNLFVKDFHIGVFKFRYGFFLKKLNVSIEHLRQMDAEGWRSLEQKVKKWAVQTNRQNKPISVEWVTGTRSSALIGMTRAVKKGLSPGPALVPTGQLINRNIVPLCGELGGGIILTGGINHYALSGTMFDHCTVAHGYAHLKMCISNPEKELEEVLSFPLNHLALNISRLKIAVLRLIHSGASQTILKKAKEHIKNHILSKMKAPPREWEILSTFVGKETKDLPVAPLASQKVIHPLPPGTLVGVKKSGGAVKFGLIGNYYPEHQKYTVIIDHVDHNVQTRTTKHNELVVYDQEKLFTYAEDKVLPSIVALQTMEGFILKDDEYLARIEAILSLFDTEEPLQLSEQEKALLDDSFPLIWGATEKSHLNLKYVRSDCSEHLHIGTLKLGSDITIAFTKSKKISEVNQWLRNHNVHGVKVMSFGAMAYLHALRH